MFMSLLITPMMLAVNQPMVEVPSTLVYDHQSQTTIGMLSSQSAVLLAGTLCTSTGTGNPGCTFDGNCTDSDTDGDC